MTEQKQPVRRARHLMDPDNPRPQQPRRDSMSLSQVQKWVMSILATTTIFHLSAGIVIAAYFLDDKKTGSQIGLLVIAGLFGVVAMSVGFLIHQKKLPNLWLLFGWVPSIVGAWLIFG
jgi:hypothetical protein